MLEDVFIPKSACKVLFFMLGTTENSTTVIARLIYSVRFVQYSANYMLLVCLWPDIAPEFRQNY